MDYSKYFPGTVKVDEKVYYGTYEVTNYEWLEYLASIEVQYGKESEQYTDAYPDTLVWRSNNWSADPYVEYYLTHPAYQSYPVVGITWEQASAYCQWKTEQVRLQLEQDGRLEKVPPYFTYRLPNEEEFMTMFENMNQYPNQIGEEGPRKYEGMYRYNLRRKVEQEDGVAGQLNDNADVTAPVKSYWPNDFGVYNIKGNVSEWLLTPDTHAGGSWHDMPDGDHAAAKTESEAAANIGVRCVCSVEFDAP